MKSTTLLTALLLAAVPGLVAAAEVDSTNRIDKRQEAQEKRIEKGQKSGDLTGKESKRLENRQKRIDAAEKEAMKDKKMTKEERARIEKMQDRQARDIKRQDSDKQERGAAARRSSASAGTSAGQKLTQREKDQAYLEAEEKKAMADGVISPREKVHLGNIRSRMGLPNKENEQRSAD